MEHLVHRAFESDHSAEVARKTLWHPRSKQKLEEHLDLLHCLPRS